MRRFEDLPHYAKICIVAISILMLGYLYASPAPEYVVRRPYYFPAAVPVHTTSTPQQRCEPQRVLLASGVSEIQSRYCLEARGYAFLGRCFCRAGWGGHNCNEHRPVPHCTPDSDACFETECGVAVISHERWRRAQKAESAAWRAARGSRSGDRVQDHIAGFAGYSRLPDNLGHLIEVGCGPWTQTEWILATRSNASVRSVTLWEPGISDYITYEGCTYRTGRLRNHLTYLVSEGAETLNAVEVYDTLVMINVLEHVRDAFEVLENVYNSIRPGGVLVFADRWFESYDYSVRVDEATTLDRVYHPIRFKKIVFDHFLSHFSPLYANYDSQSFKKYGHTGVYFIGTKKAKPPTQDLLW